MSQALDRALSEVEQIFIHYKYTCMSDDELAVFCHTRPVIIKKYRLKNQLIRSREDSLKICARPFKYVGMPPELRKEVVFNFLNQIS